MNVEKVLYADYAPFANNEQANIDYLNVCLVLTLLYSGFIIAFKLSEINETTTSDHGIIAPSAGHVLAALLLCTDSLVLDRNN